MLALIVAAVLCELNLSRVSIDIYDSLEVLERGLQKPATKHIKEAKWTSVVIRDDEYPTLQSAKNNMNGTFRQLLWDEWNKAKELYNKANVQQSELYYHPAGPGSYGSTMDEINKAERVKRARNNRLSLWCLPLLWDLHTPWRGGNHRNPGGGQGSLASPVQPAVEELWRVRNPV